MSNRISKVYTRTGDAGSTDTGYGVRTLKNDIVVSLYGELDELNSHIGHLIQEIKRDHDDISSINFEQDVNIIIEILETIQNLLFDFAGDVIVENRHSITDAHSTWLEGWIDRFNEKLPYLKEFVLPRGSSSVTFCHIVRTVCRRAERTMVSYINEKSTNAELRPHLKFLNRLSDCLFVFSRTLHKSNIEYSWRKNIRLPVPSDFE